jgi:hypothetical protein
MDNCPECEEGELYEHAVYISGGWVQVIVKCNACDTMFQGDIQIDDLFVVED